MENKIYTSYKQLKEDYRTSLLDAIENKETGAEFLKEAFLEEMENNNYINNGNLEAVLNCIGLTGEDYNKPEIIETYKLAKEELIAKTPKKKKDLFLDF